MWKYLWSTELLTLNQTIRRNLSHLRQWYDSFKVVWIVQLCSHTCNFVICALQLMKMLCTLGEA
jgi:hypothetical protein